MLDQFNLLYSTLIEQLLPKNVICIYPGRFQPFHPGHHAVYKIGASKFGATNTFIATSNKTDEERSPFNFEEKKTIITEIFTDVPSENIIEVKNPYRPIEITSKFDENSTAVVFLLGEKDAERLINSKYYVKYEDDIKLDTYRNHGYVYVIDDQENGINGSDIRDSLKNSNSIKTALNTIYTDKTINNNVVQLFKTKFKPIQ